MSIRVFHASHASNQLPNLDTSRSAGPDQLHTQSSWQLSKWRPMSLSAVVWTTIGQILKRFILLILGDCNEITDCYCGFLSRQQCLSNVLFTRHCWCGELRFCLGIQLGCLNVRFCTLLFPSTLPKKSNWNWRQNWQTARKFNEHEICRYIEGFT